MSTERVPLVGLSPEAYEHPTDGAALQTLRRVPGFDTLLRKVLGAIGDRTVRFATLASAVRVSERQFPEVHAAYLQACEALDVREPPELYVAQTPLVNAGAVGIDEPFIVLNSGTLALFNNDELQFVLGHELGHILSDHVLYKTMLALLLRTSLLALAVPLGGAAVFAISAALLEWDRKSELSADRAGLLAVQDPELALRVHMKMAGGGRTEQMDVEAFREQAREYRESGGVMDGIVKLMNLLGRRHPFSVLRLTELDDWVAAGDYQRILDGDYPRRGDAAAPSAYEELKVSTAPPRDGGEGLGGLLRDVGGELQTVGERLGRLWTRRDGQDD